MIRGLIERIDNPDDARSYLYKPTLDLLSHLGISKIADLPEYGEVKKDIESFKQSAAPASAEARDSATIGE
jgi:chromosome segregation and condensation protein ScpB